MDATRITSLAGAALSLVLATGGVAMASAPATEGGVVTAVARVAADDDAAGTGIDPAPRTVTLVTGERVRLAGAAGGHTVATLEPAPATGPAGAPRRVRTMRVGAHSYVVPQSAAPYLGRQLDLALFDVARPVRDVQVLWADGARPHAVPGLTLEAARDGRSAGRVSSPAAFGAALATATAPDRSAAADAGPLAGIASIGPAGAVGPPVGPAYPQATLLVKGIDALGAPAVSGGVSVSNNDDALRFATMSSFVEGEVAFSVPVGTYSLSIDVTTLTADAGYVSDALLVFPEVEVTAPETVVTADARTAGTKVPVPSTPKPSIGAQLDMTYGRTAANGTQSTTTYLMAGGSPVVYVTPTKPVTVGELHWYTGFHLDSPGTSAEKYAYDLHFPADGVVPDRFATTVDESGLARLDTAYHADDPSHPITVLRASFSPWEQMPFRMANPLTAPQRRTEYVSALPDVAWMGMVTWRPDESNGIVQGPLTVYRPGQRLPDDYLAAPVAPGVADGTAQPLPCGACRQGDTLGLDVKPWLDPGGHVVGTLIPSGTLDVSTATRLYADGALVAQTSLPTGTVNLGSAPAAYRLELDTVKSAAWTNTATRTSTAWSWTSATRTGTLPEQRLCADGGRNCAFEPLLFVTYATGADLTNAVPAGGTATIGLDVHHQRYDSAPAADTLALDVSTDDGTSWAPVAVRSDGGGHFTAAVPVGSAPGFLSLRVRAADPAGSAVDQTVIRAVRVVVG